MTGGTTIKAVVAASLVAAALIPATSAAAEPGVVTDYPIPVESDPYAVATGPEGKIWFVASSRGHVGRMTTAGAISAAEVVPFPNSGLAQAITLGPDGNMWVEQFGHLDKVPPSVNSTEQITAYEYPVHPGSDGYGSIATGPDGRLWIGLTEELAVSTTSGEMLLYPTGSPTNQVSGVISGPGERLWFGAGNQIRRIATNGGFSEAEVIKLPEGDSQINDLALGRDGNVWFTLGAPAAVGKVTPAGEITLFRTPAASSLPFGIAAGPDGHMWFTERNADAVGSIPLTATSGSEIHEYPVGHANAGALGIVAGPDNRMWFAESNENRLGAITTGAAAPVSGGGPPTGGSTAPGGSTTPVHRVLPPNPTPVGCVAERLSLLDVLARAGAAHLTGVAPRSAIGQRVKIISSWNGKVIASVKVGGGGAFTATVAAPPSRFRHGAKGSYAVELGKLKSARVGYSRRLYTTAITASGQTIEFAGSVTQPLAKPAAAVTIRAASTCAGITKGTVVAKVTPGRSGAFNANITLPAGLEAGSSVYLRAETVVRSGRKAHSTVGLVRGIALTQ
jgi:streptogramin lyase